MSKSSSAAPQTASARNRAAAVRRTAAAPGTDLCEVACLDPGKVRRVRGGMKPPRAVEDLALTFKLLGDPTRLRIVHALSREELCVCDLAAVLGMSQSVTSHSLRALRQLHLVRYRREGKVAYYSLDDAHIESLVTEGFRHVEEVR